MLHFRAFKAGSCSGYQEDQRCRSLLLLVGIVEFVHVPEHTGNLALREHFNRADFGRNIFWQHLGNRHFEVLHLPGHSPGSIGLFEAATETLFSGDAVYDGPLLDELPESDISDYVRTMKRLLELPVRVVHAGHDPSFGGERLRELASAYLERRDCYPPGS